MKWYKIKRLFCRLFGHRLNENVQNHWCDRCGLAYEEIYGGMDAYEDMYGA